MKDVIGTIVRHSLSLAAGWLTAKGFDISGIDINELAAAIAAILAAAMSLAKSAKAKKELIVAKTT